MMRKKAVLAAVMALMLCTAGCGGGYNSSAAPSADQAYEDSKAEGNYASEAAEEAAYSEDYDSEYDNSTYEDAASGQGDNGSGTAGTEGSDSALRAQDGQKIVYTGNLKIQTLEYEKSASSIRRKIREYGGFTESENESDDNRTWYYEDSSGSRRSLSLIARIPSEKFEEFMDSLSGDGKILSRSMNAENISQQYANKENYKKALEKEQERLLAMMDKAGTIEEMIAVEERLSEVERQLNAFKTDLSAMDKDVQFSTIYIDLTEVKRYTEEPHVTTFGERIENAFDDAISGFVNLCQGIVLFAVRYFPYLILLVIVIILLLRLDKKSKEKRLAMMSNPEYAKMVNERARVKAEMAARKRAEKEAKKEARRNGRGGLFGRGGKNTAPGAEVNPTEGANFGMKAGMNPDAGQDGGADEAGNRE